MCSYYIIYFRQQGEREWTLLFVKYYFYKNKHFFQWLLCAQILLNLVSKLFNLTILIANYLNSFFVFTCKQESCTHKYSASFLDWCCEPDVPNGDYEVTGYSTGDNITFTCDDYYEPVGPTHGVCQADRTWSIEPYCRGMYCYHNYI